MSDFLDFINNLTIEATSNCSYVYYDEKTGAISKISNNKDTDSTESILEIEHEEVIDIIEGKEQLADFFVSYDLAKKKTTINKIIRDSTDTKVSYRLHQVPESNEPTDIKFVMDPKHNSLKLVASEELRNDMVLRKQCENMKMHFSITEKNNPNILYEAITIPMTEILSQPYIDVNKLFVYRTLIDNASIYTAKYFETYSLEVI